MTGAISHDALQLREALQRTLRPVIFDTETTGLNVRTDRILSLGWRVHADGQWQNFILFSESCSQRSIRPQVTPWPEIRRALAPLERPKLTVVGHNVKYDLLMLRREGVEYRGHTRDTQTLLRLEDQDRTFTKETMGRRYLRAPLGQQWSDYTLKNSAYHLLNIKPYYTPSPSMDMVDYGAHLTYLVHDLLTTHELHKYLWGGLSAGLRRHYAEVQSPLAIMLCDLRWHGVAADRAFIVSELGRLQALMAGISSRHQDAYARPLTGMTDEQCRDLLYQQYRLPYRRRNNQKPTVSAEAIAQLLERTTDPLIQGSIQLISAYRESQSLHLRLGGYLKAIESDGKFHSQVDNRQASGRLSSSKPNLQQIAAAKVILKGDPLEAEFRSRNLIVPSAGCILVAADVAQADVRVLAHEIDRCTESTQEHFKRLQKERFRRLPKAAELWRNRVKFENAGWSGDAPPPPPQFNPHAVSLLVQNFVQSPGDFYSEVASQVTGRTIVKTDPERNTWKTVLLAQINSETATGLAKRWNCSKADAQKLIDKFFQAYPDIASWTSLQRQQVALTGETHTWAGRRRRNTAHAWMVGQRRVRLLLTYKQGPRRWRYWFDVEPIRPAERYLTCLVHRVWNISDENGPKSAKLIYEMTRGRIGTKPYRHLDEPGRYILPLRNVPWRNIRRVQRLDRKHEPVEMARYEGLDTTCRPLINSIMQGGTVDVVTLMMLRCRQLCSQLGGRLLINVHDELVLQIPEIHLSAFIAGLKQTLARRPGPGWRIPIALEFKVGRQFGAMTQLP